MNNGRTILDLWDEFNAMPENQTLEKIRHFGISIEIFNGNYNELIHHLKIHNDPRVSLALMNVDKRHLLHAYQREITRFLHNYIAASLSLRDHARNHYRELYSKNNLFSDYQGEIDKRFTRNPLAVFISDLRQYFQHYQMPGVSSRVAYKNGESDFQMTLLIPIKELQKYSKWNALSKAFLEEQTDDINLITLVSEYHDLIETFYKWFIDRQMKIHQDDIKKVNVHKNKIKGLELSQFLMQFVQQPKTIEEFEAGFFMLFPNVEIEQVRSAVTKADRIEVILKLLLKENFLMIKPKLILEKFTPKL
ncbi:MAG TPA: hypothetical protein VK783_00870 [Bacteroidia bacterium]|jgi:hypothetical protein|nr:hypothetical protein [Bacteroidia bacterium]